MRLTIVTPGIGVGYGKERNTPLRARWSAGSAVMSSPLRITWPSSTTYDGLPAMVLAIVLLPEPLGPMIAWISPGRISRSMPCRIWISGFSAMLAFSPFS